MYQLTETNASIIRTSDGLVIPTDCNNADYRAYLAYLINGNLPLPCPTNTTTGPKMNIPVVFDMFRDANVPLVGNKTSTWNVGGSCFTAQSIIFHEYCLQYLDIERAIWRLTWLPNIPTSSQTGVRLCSADSGPSNIAEITSFFGSANVTNPRNDAVDITTSLKTLIDSHRVTPSMFQIFMQTAGDGVYGPLIYSSAIECVFNA